MIDNFLMVLAIDLRTATLLVQSNLVTSTQFDVLQEHVYLHKQVPQQHQWHHLLLLLNWTLIQDTVPDGIFNDVVSLDSSHILVQLAMKSGGYWKLMFLSVLNLLPHFFEFSMIPKDVLVDVLDNEFRIFLLFAELGSRHFSRAFFWNLLIEPIKKHVEVLLRKL